MAEGSGDVAGKETNSWWCAESQDPARKVTANLGIKADVKDLLIQKRAHTRWLQKAFAFFPTRTLLAARLACAASFLPTLALFSTLVISTL